MLANIVSRPGSSRFPSWLLPAAGYAVSIACLIWVYRGFDWSGEWRRIKATDWSWVTLAVAGDLTVYVCMGWRWHMLLRPLSRISLRRTVQAIYIGLFANEVLPLRTGEVIRCYLVSRWGNLPFPAALSSAVIERLMDGFWLMIGVYLASSFVTLPRWFIDGSRALTVLILVLAVLVVAAVIRRSQAHRAVAENRFGAWLRNVVDAVHLMGRSPSFAGAMVLSFFYLALQVLPIWALMEGYGLRLGVWHAAVVMVVVRLGGVPPQAPGNVGSVQAMAVLVLTLFGVDRPEATGFATLLFVVVTVPLWLAGFLALMLTRMRLVDIRQAAEDHMNGR
ncbi:MAG: lysylphosphatidylglycerol synthase transmembrane domain-containing protein [Bryobacteraceae bacterium]